MSKNERRNMVPLKVDLVSSDEGDWEGMYINDVLVEEGHSLDLGNVLTLLGIEYNKHTYHGDENLPDHLEDLEDASGNTR